MSTNTTSNIQSKQEIVVSNLRREILHGDLKPGQRLTQDEIAKRFGISWTPVREALRQLEAEGWVQIKNNQGAVVAPLSLQDFNDIYQYRLLIQPEAARLSVEHMDDQTLSKLETIYQQQAQLDLHNPEEREIFLKFSHDFYVVFYDAGKNKRLATQVILLREAADRYVRASFKVPTEAKRHLEVQRQLLELCILKDGSAAAEVMRYALIKVRSVVNSILSSQKELITELEKADGSLKRSDKNSQNNLLEYAVPMI
ncbi:MAG: transcriptional regulator [Chloroflexi bacterium]|jgi:DNA-binding GntR family transcriptional regulator|nr:transcriptional regulator [Chloroflexota bacterium]